MNKTVRFRAPKTRRYSRDAVRAARDVLPPRFPLVSCSQCGGDFGPGNFGYSDCRSHLRKNPLPHGRAFEQIYRTRERRPKWNVKVSPLMDPQAGGQMLRRRLPKMSKAEHVAAAQEFADAAARLRDEHSAAWYIAFNRRFGRAPGPLDFRISGIGNDELSRAAKDRLSGLAHAASNYGDASAAHWRAAGKRGPFPKGREPHYEVAAVTRARKNPGGIYVGLLRGKPGSRELFRADRTPTVQSHGAKYGAVIGPFRTVKAARLAVAPHGPLMQHVSDFERAAKKNPAPRREKGMMRKNPSRKMLPEGTMKRIATLMQDCGYSYAESVSEAKRALIAFARGGGKDLTIQIRRGPRIRLKGSRAKKNPAARRELGGAADLEAARRFEDFTGHPVTTGQKFDFPGNPKTGFAVGPVSMIGYEASRDGERATYVHRFKKKARPLLAASHDGRDLFLLGGAYRFTDRGIEDS